MAEKILELDSTQAGRARRRSTCYLASIYCNDSREQVWGKNVQGQGGSSSSIKRIAKSARLSTSKSNGSISHALSLTSGVLKHDAPKPLSFVQETPPAADQHSETSKSAGLIKAKGKADHNCNYYDDEPLSESSSLSDINDEQPEGVAVKDKLGREGTGVKRNRNAKIHNFYERKRRDKINKKMHILKELIPNCNRMDIASILDDAMEYIKTLKFQLQIMPMVPRMPLMMLLSATHHMNMINNTPHLPHLMGAGTGFFMPGTGIIPCSSHLFPIAPFPNQVPPLPISHAPFIPMVGNPSMQPLLATTKMAENQASSQLNMLNSSVPKNSS